MMEIVGIIILGFGICFAIAIVALLFDDERVRGEKPNIQQAVDEMEAKLATAGVPEEQVVGLLKIHKSVVVAQAVHQHFIVTSFLSLLSLLIASFGFTLMLLGKLNRLVAAAKPSSGDSDTGGSEF